MIGLVTGSQPFAGLPDNPAEHLLPEVEGASFHSVTIRSVATPVSVETVPETIAGLIAEHRPVFHVALGLALGTPVLRLETTAINRLDFAVADNFGQRPADGRVNAGLRFPRSAGAKFPTLRVRRSAVEVISASALGWPASPFRRRWGRDAGMRTCMLRYQIRVMPKAVAGPLDLNHNSMMQ